MCGKGRAVHKTKSEKPNIKWDRHLGTTEGLEEESAYNLFFLLKATGCFQVSKNKIVACVFKHVMCFIVTWNLVQELGSFRRLFLPTP